MNRKYEREVIAFLCSMGISLIVIIVSLKNIMEHC